MKPLVVIPARKGSKGIPNKNIKLLGSKPLIYYTIEAAREVFPDDQICVSTDSNEIKEIVEKTGLKVPFIRPAKLATDKSGTQEVLLHAIKFYERKKLLFDSIILLQPTSPFRNSKHIIEAVNVYNNCQNCEMVVSVKETKANPYYVLREESKEGWLVKVKENSFNRRQDCPKVYEINGAIYIMRKDVLKEKAINTFKYTCKYLMENIESHDIDDMQDWILANALINMR